jgi:hypothetical protein
MKKALTFCNTHTIPLIGILGAMRHLKEQKLKINRYSSQLDIQPAIGVM